MFTIFMIILFIVLAVGRIAAGFYAKSVPFLDAISPLLTCLCIIAGIVAAVLIGIKIFKEIRR